MQHGGPGAKSPGLQFQRRTENIMSIESLTKRRARYAENKDRINATLRAAYATDEAKILRAAPDAQGRKKAASEKYYNTPGALALRQAYWASPGYKSKYKARRLQPKPSAQYIANRLGVPIEIPNRPRPEFCECCGGSPSNHALHLDHCHDTGRFRGWCCHGCNVGSGIMDNSRRLRLRALYLERPFQQGPINWAYPKGWKEDLSHAV